jgi:hypothetical protein
MRSIQHGVCQGAIRKIGLDHAGFHDDRDPADPRLTIR